jgi:N4-gp56 family major capsid protein
MYSDNLSEELRFAVQPLTKFRQFCDVQEALGKHKGELYHWNVYNDVATGGTVLVETTTMPETNFTITQGTLTVTEYGNSVPYTGKLDGLSEHNVKEVIHKVLKHDAKKAFDTAAHGQFDSTLLIAQPTGGTDTAAITLYVDGTATQTNNVALNNAHVKNIVDTMKERDIPPYVNDDYYALARPTTYRTFKNNLETIKQYSDVGFQLIMNGEIGRYENVRYVEQTHIASEAWTNGASDAVYFFGDDTVTEAITVPEEMRGKIPSDFGRSKGIAWYYIGGFGIVHTVAAQSRIVKWASAA